MTGLQPSCAPLLRWREGLRFAAELTPTDHQDKKTELERRVDQRLEALERLRGSLVNAPMSETGKPHSLSGLRSGVSRERDWHDP